MKDNVYVFDFDGTIVRSNIYTPIVLFLRSHNKYFSLFILYALAPLIILLDKISRPLHQFIYYFVFQKILIGFSCKQSLNEIYLSNKVSITSSLIDQVQDKSKVYILSTNCSVINEFLISEFKLRESNIYTVKLPNPSLKYLQTFKEFAIKKIIDNNNECKFLGYGDSKNDLDFIKYCDKGFLYENKKLVEVER